MVSHQLISIKFPKWTQKHVMGISDILRAGTQDENIDRVDPSQRLAGPATVYDAEMIYNQVAHMLKRSNESEIPAGENEPTLTISPEKVCFIIIKAKEFDTKDEVTEPDPDRILRMTRMLRCSKTMKTTLSLRNSRHLSIACRRMSRSISSPSHGSVGMTTPPATGQRFAKRQPVLTMNARPTTFLERAARWRLLGGRPVHARLFLRGVRNRAALILPTG